MKPCNVYFHQYWCILCLRFASLLVSFIRVTRFLPTHTHTLRRGPLELNTWTKDVGRSKVARNLHHFSSLWNEEPKKSKTIRLAKELTLCSCSADRKRDNCVVFARKVFLYNLLNSILCNVRTEFHIVRKVWFPPFSLSLSHNSFYLFYIIYIVAY